jgi:3-dehydroquinate synthase
VRVSEPLLVAENLDLLCGGKVPGRRFVIVDDGVPQALQDNLRTYLETHGVEARLKALPGGESCKSLDTVIDILTEIDDFGVERRDEPILVVGGGAVLDAGGFAASIYRRGVPFVRVPTTLLAYVDAAVGVKTGVNFARRKNLVGTFAAPLMVLLDRGFLGSLPASEVSSGMGEVLKLAVGCDAGLFDLLDDQADHVDAKWLMHQVGAEVLERSIDVMLRELGKNLLEDDLRRIVDLGHTFSQAFEMRRGAVGLRHGEAVALDLNLSAVIAARRGLLAHGDVERLARLTRRLGLPTQAPLIEPSELWNSVVDRTRHRGGRQSIPLPERIGSCVFVDDLTPKELCAAVDALSKTPVQ